MGLITGAAHARKLRDPLALFLVQSLVAQEASAPSPVLESARYSSKSY